MVGFSADFHPIDVDAQRVAQFVFQWDADD
jgi:hypothetical protein